MRVFASLSALARVAGRDWSDDELRADLAEETARLFAWGPRCASVSLGYSTRNDGTPSLTFLLD